MIPSPAVRSLVLFLVACRAPSPVTTKPAAEPAPDVLVDFAIDHANLRAEWHGIVGRSTDPMGEAAIDVMAEGPVMATGLALAALAERGAQLVDGTTVAGPRAALTRELARSEPETTAVDAAAAAIVRALDRAVLDALRARGDRAAGCVAARLALAVALADLDHALADETVDNEADLHDTGLHEGDAEFAEVQDAYDERVRAIDAWIAWRDEPRVRALEAVADAPVDAPAPPPTRGAIGPGLELGRLLTQARAACGAAVRR